RARPYWGTRRNGSWHVAARPRSVASPSRKTGDRTIRQKCLPQGGIPAFSQLGFALDEVESREPRRCKDGAIGIRRQQEIVEPECGAVRLGERVTDARTLPDRRLHVAHESILCIGLAPAKSRQRVVVHADQAAARLQVGRDRSSERQELAGAAGIVE